jgi:peptide/nickel transport system permease protein
MQRYVIRRLIWLVFTLWLMVTMLFFLMYVIPGDIVMVMLGEETESIDPVQYEILKHKLGLDRPVWEQYANWLWNAVQGDLGESYWTGAPVVEEMKIRFPYTIGLMIISLVITIVVALPVGVISALKQDTFADYALRSFQIGGLSMPGFWLGILILGFLAVTFRWHPRIEYATLFTDPVTALQQYWLPAFLMGFRSSANDARMLRSTMLEVIGSDYIRTARAKGLKEWVVIYVHALRNAILPGVTMLGMEAAGLLGGTVIMETLFNIPGLGTLLISAVNARDIPLVMGVVVFKGFIILFVNLLVDISYGFIDPRVRYE